MAPKLSPASGGQRAPAQASFPVKADSSILKQVYLVTIPHPRTAKKRLSVKTSPPPLPLIRSPAEFDHAGIERAVLDSAASPVYDNPGQVPPVGGVPLDMMAIFRELHQADAAVGVEPYRKPHYHIVIKGKRSFRFLPIKRAMRARHGLETNWSWGEEGYHGPLRYCAVPSPAKPAAELDPSPRLWAASGTHPPLIEACEEPMTLAAIKAKREKAIIRASEEGKSDPRPTLMDLYAAVVQAGFRNAPDDQYAAEKLIQYLKGTSLSLFGLAFKMRSQLPGFINDVWKWESVGDTVAVTSLPRMKRVELAAERPCVCGGLWPQHAYNVFSNNALSPGEFFAEVRRSLQHGRGPTTKVVVIAGERGGEGKSYLLAPLRKVFGEEHVQESPQPGSFPLLGLESKSLVIMDDWRFDEAVLRMATQLLWYEGKPFPVSTPQNQPGTFGHSVYRGTAPIFVSTKASYLNNMKRLAEWAERVGQPSEHTMLPRLLKICTLGKPTPVPWGYGDCRACVLLRAHGALLGRPGPWRESWIRWQRAEHVWHRHERVVSGAGKSRGDHRPLLLCMGAILRLVLPVHTRA